MSYTTDSTLRSPKGCLAMFGVYSFTGAAILASIIFSLLLFLSIDSDPWMQFLFGSLAVIFELGKFFAWYEVGERQAHKNYSGAAIAFAFYIVLAAISIGGSIGGINSATNSAQSHVQIQQNRVSSYNMQIEAIEKQIALNNVAAEKYIELELISTGLARIQRENSTLREKQQTLAVERDNLPAVKQGSVVGLIESLANSLNVTPQNAQLGLVIFLSVLLDFFAAFFVGLIGEEQRFKYRFNKHKSQGSEVEPDTQNPEVERLAIREELKSGLEQKPEQIKSIYDQAFDALESEKISCSKKAVKNYLKIEPEEVDIIFKQLLQQGLVIKKANHHYQWQGTAAVIEEVAA